MNNKILYSNVYTQNRQMLVLKKNKDMNNPIACMHNTHCIVFNNTKLT